MNTVSENKNHPSYLRLLRLREFLKSEGVDFYIITTSDPHMSEYLSPVDKIREYISGFTGSAGTLLVSENNAYLWTDGRYHIQAQNELESSSVILMKEGTIGVPSLFDFLKDNVKSNDVIGFDGQYVSIEYVERLKSKIGDNVTYRSDVKLCNSVWPNRPKRCFNTAYPVEEFDAGCSTGEKLERLRKKICAKYDLPQNEIVYIVSELNDIMYLLNIRGTDVLYVPVAFSYLVIYMDKAILYAGKDILSLNETDKLNGFGVFVKDYYEFYDDLCKIKGKKVFVDKSICNSSILDLLKDTNEIVFCKNYDYVQKHIKNDTEIKCFRKYHIEDAACMIRFIRLLKEKVSKEPGSINEYDAAMMLDKIRLKSKNCKGISFETISAYKENGAIVHYSAPKTSSKILKNEGLYLVDSGGHYPSCTTDITRTVALGPVSEYEKKCYTAVLKGNLRLSSAVFVNDARGENLDALARGPLWEMGLDYLHGTGHGIGSNLSVHEGPIAIRYKIRENSPTPYLAPGNVISDEPGVYIEGKFGIRLENELLVEKKYSNESGDFYGFDILTLVPFERDAIIKDDLSDKELEILNLYHAHIYDVLSPILESEDKIWLFDVTKPI